MKIQDFKIYKGNAEAITMLTCYDSSSAKLLEASDVDCILVGDSVAMTIHGYDSTLPATPAMMATHTAAVRRGAPTTFIVGDMPFMSYRKGLSSAMECVEKLMQAGANSIKLEGCAGNEEIIRHIIESGVPVMGHLGLTPQAVNALGGYRVQGRENKHAQKLLRDAKMLQELGCFATVLECVPAQIATEISRELTIPTIGIGAGNGCDGQVLVWQDMLGITSGFRPKFVRRFLEAETVMAKSIKEFIDAVKDRSFPNEQESYQ